MLWKNKTKNIGGESAQGFTVSQFTFSEREHKSYDNRNQFTESQKKKKMQGRGMF